MRAQLLLTIVFAIAACGTRYSVRTDADTLADAPSDIDSSADASDTPAPDFAWYICNETSGLVAHDSTANHYDVTLSGVTWSAGAIFDGATDCGEVNVGAAFRTPPVTISAWLTADLRQDYEETTNPNHLNPYPSNALSGDVAGNFGYGIGLNTWSAGSNVGGAIGIETGWGFTSIGGTFSVGVEYFVLVAENATTATLYVNGSRFSQITAGTPGAATPATLRLGCHNSDTGYGTLRFYKGKIRDARIYTRLVGATEVAQLYANGPTTTAP